MKEAILITGASGDIGQAIAKTLARAGYSLYLHYHKNKETIAGLIEEFETKNLGGEYIPIQADLRKKEDVMRLCQEIYQIDGIIHNSGVSVTKLLTQMIDEEIEELMAVHVTSPMLITKTLLPKIIRQKRGNIIFISSIWGQTGASCETVYSAAKGAQIAFAKALSKELAPSRIRVNCVAPGSIRTKMLNHLDENELEEIITDIPLGRLGTPEDVAQAVQFLLSENARRAQVLTDVASDVRLHER